MISITSKGYFEKTRKRLNAMKNVNILGILNSCGQDGVNALASATPVESGLVATSWDYEVVQEKSGYSLIWTNSDVENGFPVAIMLQYGYATGTGGYVQGQDYINSAMKPIFDEIAHRVWKAVTSA